MKNETYFLERIKKIQSTSQIKIESLNERFNLLKTEIRDLNDYLLMNKILSLKKTRYLLTLKK